MKQPEPMETVYARIKSGELKAQVISLDDCRRHRNRGLVNALKLSLEFARENGRLPTSEDFSK